MLVELAIGDAYGAGFEYVKPAIVAAQNTLERYVQHPRHGTKPGQYTDDTQMSIAVAESLVSGEPWTPKNLAQRFVTAFRRDPREGYASRFFSFLQRMQDGDQFLREIEPNSDKSGAAMRAAPIGVMKSIQDVIEMATIQARITHDTPDGIAAAVAAALMAHYFIYDLGAKRDLGKFLDSHVKGPWNSPWQGEVGAKGWMSVQAAVTAVMNHDRMKEILRECIAFTGDVDTVAAIAMAASAHIREVAKDLPNTLYEGLESGAFGKQFLIELDSKLMALVKQA